MFYVDALSDIASPHKTAKIGLPIPGNNFKGKYLCDIFTANFHLKGLGHEVHSNILTKMDTSIGAK
jgi:hypothetical protein